MIRVQVKGQLDVSSTRRQLADATKAGLLAAVEQWHEQYLVGHFTVEGGKKYGYQKRRGDDEPPRIAVRRPDGKVSYRTNQAYSWRKRRQKRHNIPLVWSGLSIEMARKQVRLSAVKRGSGLVAGTAAMTLPRYFYQYLKPGTYGVQSGWRSSMTLSHQTPNKADELTRTTPDEVEVLGRTVQARIVRELSALRGGTAAAA